MLKHPLASTGALLIGATLASLFLSSCGGGGGDSSSQLRTSFGITKSYGAGTTRSFYKSKGGVPVELGIEISAAALADPATLPPAPQGQAASEVTAALPADALAQTPFLSASMFYTTGHEPTGQQDVPHFHPAWFVIPGATRAAIFPGAPGVDTVPPTAEVPTGYITPPDPTFAFIPSLGNIYFNPAEPGYTEAPFATGLSEYRYFQGHMSLIALGAPLTKLQSKTVLNAPMGVPAKYPRPGYYPTNYSVSFDAARQVHIFSISGFVKRG